MRCTSVVIADHHPVVASKLLHPAVTVRAASKRFHTGDNSAGNGGDGYFAGTLIDRSYAAFEPLNMAQAGAHATANAHQTNIGIFDQAATQIAGTGGDGGDWNAAMGGSVGVFGAIGSDVIATGDNSARNGGDGHFSGALVHAPVAVFDPINIAVAGFHGAADAHQSNTLQFLQGASQAAGGGGHGGDGNVAIGGGVSVSGAGATAARSSGPATRPQAHDLDHDLDHDSGRPPPENFSARTDRVRTC